LEYIAGRRKRKGLGHVSDFAHKYGYFGAFKLSFDGEEILEDSDRIGGIEECQNYGHIGFFWRTV
jgi:hypothetical protein